MNKHWTKEELEAAKATLSRHSSFESALAEISSSIRPVSTPRRLWDVFKRAGLETPSSFLGRAAQPAADGLTRILVCPDVHIPGHDELAWSTFLAVGREMHPDVLVFLGDVMDAESVSRHSKGPDRNRFLKADIDAVNVELDRVEALKIPRVEWLMGNHCVRVETYVNDRAPELFGLVDAASLLRLKDRGWNWTPYKQHIKIGKIGFTHDLGYAGKNATASSLAAFGGSIIVGHSHRASVVYGGDVQGERHVAISSGWLGSIEKCAKYMHRSSAERDWQHAFTWITMKADGVAWCQLIPILNGECIVDGKLIRG